MTATVRPAKKVTVPKDELTAAEIVISPVAPTDVKDTLPKPPAVMTPLTVMVEGLACAAKVTEPVVVVTIPAAPTIMLPVAAVKDRLMPVKAAVIVVSVAVEVTL